MMYGNYDEAYHIKKAEMLDTDTIKYYEEEQDFYTIFRW